MSRILYSRVFRCLVCLLLISCILVNLSPLKAEASAAAGAAIIKASTVTCNPAVVVGAALIALGVWAGTNPDEFRNVVNNAVSFLETAGGWIVDGSMELLRTVSEAGTYGYYVTAEFLETMRSWLFFSGALTHTVYGEYIPVGVTYNGFCYRAPVKAFKVYAFQTISATRAQVYYFDGVVAAEANTKFSRYVVNADGSESGYPQTTSTTIVNGVTHYIDAFTSSTGYYNLTDLADTFDNQGYTLVSGYATNIGSLIGGFFDDPSEVSTSYDLTLGYVSEAAIDLGFDDDEAAAYNRSQLRVIEGGGSDPDDDNDPVIYFPIIPGEYSEIEEMTQEDQWNGTAPEEFPDSTTTEEFEILDQPEIDGYQGIEIQPVIDPDTGTDTDPDTDPTTAPGSGSDPDTDPDSNPDSDPDSNPDSDDTSGSASWKPPSDHTQFALTDLTKFFPFCIPFDLFDFFTLLDADPVAPVFSWELQDLSGQTYSIVIDLSEWDSLALLFRRLQLFLFITGLAAASRKYIKW